MISKLITVLFLLFLMFASCNQNGADDYDDDGYTGEYVTEDGYEDGTYCAEVTYYNPNTGASNDYTLEVEVENNAVVRIDFGNGGWLDSDHMTPEELDGDGECTIISDRNYEYSIRIIGQNCSYTDEASFQNDVESSICPRCGDSKDSEYDDYCYWCERKIEDEDENTCSNCGAYEIGVYGGLCSSCESDDW